MKLLSLHVQNFGKLHDVSMNFSDGINSLYRENGWGKSTLAVFIKAMFYGLPASSKRSLEENERKKYLPWQGGAYGGSITFSSQRGVFRVERFFGTKESEDSFALYDLSTKLLSDTYPPELGVALFGIDANGFERTVYLSQRMLKGKPDNNSITAKLGNLLDDPDDIGNYDTAISLLEKRKKYYIMTGSRGRIADLEREYNACMRKADDLRQYVLLLEKMDAERKEKEKALLELQEEHAILRKNLDTVLLADGRNTLRKQKEQMEEEISRIESRQAELDRLLGGRHPDDAELSHARACLGELQKARGAVDLLEQPCREEQSRKELSDRYPNGLPDVAAVQKLRKQKEDLRDALQTEKTLFDERSASGEKHPMLSGEQLRAAKDSAEQLRSLRAKRQEVPSRKRSGGAFSAFLILILFGVASMAISFLPTLRSFRIPLLAAGVTTLLTGGLIRLFAGQCGQKEQKAEAEKEQQLLQPILAVLTAYGISPVAESEPEQLDQLLRDESAKRSEQLRSMQRYKEAVEQKKKLAEALCESLQHYLPGGFPLQEMQVRTDRLLRDAEEWDRVTEAIAHRNADRRAARASYKSQRQALREILQKYPPMSDSVPLPDRVAEITTRENEFRRNGELLRRKQEEFRRFREEKQDQLAPLPEDVSGMNEKQLRAEEADLDKRIHNTEESLATLRQKIRRLSEDTDCLPDLLARQDQLQGQLQEAKVAGKTLESTIHFLEAAKQSLSTRYLSDMQKSFNRYLRLLSDADEKEVPESFIDASFDVSLRAEGKTRDTECFSRGWQDVIRFCLRLSLVSALYREGEMPFLLLDDPFVNLDDRRLAAAQRLLGFLAEEYQILYFVCRRERRL